LRSPITQNKNLTPELKMNHVDIILAIPLTIGAIRGFSKGFVHEIASLISIVVGVVLAVVFAGMAGSVLMEYVDWSPNMIKIVAFTTVFILVVIVIKAIARLIEKIFEVAGLSFVNRIAGLGAGTIKFAFLLSILLVFFNYLNRDKILMSDNTRDQSFLYNKVASFVPSIMPGMSILNYSYNFREESNSQDK
jgi:membrane protein required for colicin V production